MKKILQQLGKLLSVRFLAIGLTFIQTMILTRVFGSEVFGLLSFGLSISALLILILSFGLDQILMRDIARFGQTVAPKTKRWRQVWRLTAHLIFPLTLFIAATGLAVVILTDVGGAYQVPLFGVFALLPVVMLRKYVEAISLGTKQVLRSIIGSQIAYPFLMIIGGAIVWALDSIHLDMAVTFTYVFAVIGSLVISSILIRPTLVALKATSRVPYDTNSESPGHVAILKSGGHFALVSLGFVLGQHIDVLLMGFLANPEDVALVRIAARVAEMAGLMRAIVVLQYKPMLAEAYGQGDLVLQKRYAATMVKLFVAIGMPLTGFLWVFAEDVMRIFGPEFVSGAAAMRYFVVGVLVTLLLGPGNTILSLSDQEHLASRTLVISLAVQIVLNVWLIPIYGALGCGIANMIALMVLSVLSSALCYTRLGINPTIFGAFKAT